MGLGQQGKKDALQIAWPNRSPVSYGKPGEIPTVRWRLLNLRGVWHFVALLPEMAAADFPALLGLEWQRSQMSPKHHTDPLPSLDSSWWPGDAPSRQKLQAHYSLQLSSVTSCQLLHGLGETFGKGAGLAQSFWLILRFGAAEAHRCTLETLHTEYLWSEQLFPWGRNPKPSTSTQQVLM